MGKVLNRERLEMHDTVKNAHKYYELRVVGHYNSNGALVQADLETRYGRIGGYGRAGTEVKNVKVFNTLIEARSQMSSMSHKKRRKGYDVVSRALPDEEDTPSPKSGGRTILLNRVLG